MWIIPHKSVNLKSTLIRSFEFSFWSMADDVTTYDRERWVIDAAKKKVIFGFIKMTLAALYGWVIRGAL